VLDGREMLVRPTPGSSLSRSPSSNCRGSRRQPGRTAKSFRLSCRSSPPPGAKISHSQSLGLSNGTALCVRRSRHCLDHEHIAHRRPRIVG
jgi:hypothetical protein